MCCVYEIRSSCLMKCVKIGPSYRRSRRLSVCLSTQKLGELDVQMGLAGISRTCASALLSVRICVFTAMLQLSADTRFQVYVTQCWPVKTSWIFLINNVVPLEGFFLFFLTVQDTWSVYLFPFEQHLVVCLVKCDDGGEWNQWSVTNLTWNVN